VSKPGRDKRHISSRRSILKFGVSIGILPVVGAGCSKADADTLFTPSQAEGPFYPLQLPPDKDADLINFQGHEKKAQGTPINVVGKVLAPDGAALKNAFVEIWQADTNGRYRHPKDPNPATLDPDFQGWGSARTDEEGRYRFATIFPGAYPAGPGWMRPPHIHFKISMTNFKPLTTQMYFPGNKYNDSDLILQNLSSADQKLVVSTRMDESANENIYRFDIVLKPNR
jgi:protocatechuate 3,4-dioxygenase beta subunit